MKLNRLVFFFRYYPTRNYKSYLGVLLGIAGAIIGFCIWQALYFPYSEEYKNNIKLEITIFLFIPASIAFIAAICQRSYIMWIAFLISLPVFHYLFLNVQKDLSISNFVYVPSICFFLSALFIHQTSLSRKEKVELEKLILEEVKFIEKEVNKRWKDITLGEEPILNKDKKELNTFLIARTYQLNIRFAKELKRNYEKYVESKGHAFANTYRLGVFYYITRSYGIWDLKRIIGDNTVYIFQGREKNGEYIGNHHFGYMGAAAGFSCKVLRISAGMYQVYSGTSNWKYLFSYFDNPDDSNAIADGWTDYHNGYRF
ncbi:polymorphic toxin type 44 domain-containing protein [Bacillus sp. FJAT-49736]|uniref:polymorphic toxin type 44 domain-containing protein n=1 Tax=Bacillus sp. FJAT-49736 TaxID=2833582 RepID=UPI001BC9FF96|nr:polymorphic toxin type 44 domain-containing protein [Bacillus sp. FJAT-49736]MBS4175582.1 hypothetical protein [Bacillus sp. FJAT-49736]